MKIQRKNKDRSPRGRGQGYTVEEKVSAIKVLQENGYNLNKTAVQTGVSRSSLMAWSKQYGKEALEGDSVAIITEGVNRTAAKLKMNFLQKHYDRMSELAGQAINRALTLVKDEPDLSKVNNTIKIISDFVTKAAGEQGEEAETVRNNNLTLIEQTIIQLNKAGEGK